MSDKRPPPVERDVRERVEARMRDVGKLLGAVADEFGMGFALTFFTFGPGGWSSYISNAARADMVKALREQADLLERDQDVRAVGQDH